MRAAVLREKLGPFLIEELRDPVPGPGEILVKVAACGVCHSDLHVHNGDVNFPIPCVLGHEVSGVVAGLGDGATGVREGDRVVAAFIMPCGKCRTCLSGREELCEPFFAHNRLNGTLYDGKTRLFQPDGTPIAMYSMGGLSEFSVMPELAAAVVPDGLPLNESAIFGCALLTAFGALRHVADIQAGETVCVVGTGGVGVNIVQLARALGAGQVIAVDLGAEKLETARRMGATGVVDASGGDPVEMVRELTDGRGADVVLEAIGLPQTFRQATEMAADGGRCVMIGIAKVGRLGEVEITRLVRRKLQILGSFGGRPRSDLAELMGLAVGGKIDPAAAISERYPLEDAGEAYGRLARGEIVGRALVEL